MAGEAIRSQSAMSRHRPSLGANYGGQSIARLLRESATDRLKLSDEDLQDFLQVVGDVTEFYDSNVRPLEPMLAPQSSDQIGVGIITRRDLRDPEVGVVLFLTARGRLKLCRMLGRDNFDEGVPIDWLDALLLFGEKAVWKGISYACSVANGYATGLQYNLDMRVLEQFG